MPGELPAYAFDLVVVLGEGFEELLDDLDRHMPGLLALLKGRTVNARCVTGIGRL